MAEIDFGLAQLSETLVLFAALLYVVALFAFSWDFISGYKRQVLVDGFAYVQGKRFAAHVGVVVTVFGVLFHLGAVVTRGLAAHRVPWGNMYEFGLTGSFVIVAVFLLTLVKRDLRFLGMFILGLAVLILGAAVLVFYTPVAHLVPALQSYWLVIHVSVAVVSSGLFTVAFALSVLQLLKVRRGRKGKVGGYFGGMLEAVPGVQYLENLAYRINAVAFVMWSFTLIAGAVWAYHAWGRYWGWDPKETWTFVIWVVYASYLHARLTRGWGGVRAAWLCVFGYVCIIFNFTIVNMFFSGLHSYADLN